MYIEYMDGMVHFDKVSAARDGFRIVLDAAQAGTPVTINRDGQLTAVVDAKRLRESLAQLTRGPEVFHGEGSWWALIPDSPISADGDTVTEAIEDMVQALREYAADWVDDLHTAPNHARHWGLVQLVALSTDDELRSWITGGIERP